jgi:ATP-dependent Lon protease
MLKKEVVDSVANGKFKIYSIDNIEDGIEILTGIKPGKIKPDRTYPKGTFNFLVAKKLEELSSVLKGDKTPENNNNAKNTGKNHCDKTDKPCK